MKVLIRAEGGRRIGMGHVMRMLVLADKLRPFAEVVFICRNDEEFQTGCDYIEATGYRVLKVDGSNLLEELKGIEGDCLITDSYDVDNEYFNSARNIFNVTGYMDDLNKCHINTDFIINQNIYAGDLKYKTGSSTKLFLGTDYALLRDEFANQPKKSIKRGMKDVLITIGAADPGNLSEIIVQQLKDSFKEINFHIAVGPSFAYKESLEKLEQENIVLHHNPKMSELINKCDAAIAACGSTMYELCACSMPVIGIAAADNQLMTADKMSSIGAIKYARELEGISKCLEELDYRTRITLSETAGRLVDGHGSIRLAEEIRKILYG